MGFRDDREALRARNQALEEELAQTKRMLEGRKGKKSESGVEAPEDERLRREELQAQFPSALGYDPDGLRERENAAARRATPSIPRQVLSVFTRAWVIVVFGLPALFVVIVALKGREILPVCLAGLTLHALVVVGIDAFLRRCPSCRRLLAGKLLSIVRDQYDFHVRSWVCVHCKHRWKSQSAAYRR